MEEMSKHGAVGRAAVKAGMDRKTARKYVREGKLPSELTQPRSWRTRESPFSPEDWDAITARLEETPELEAKTLFDWLSEQHPEAYAAGQLRSLQRHVRRWRAAHGPDRELFFAQRHRPGEAAQTDFTSTAELGITLAGQLFAHLLCVVVLPYSNWQWATVCLSESIMAMRRGVQAALFQLGRVPSFHQTDNSTAATHRIPKEMREQLTGKNHPFNKEYLALMRHFEMTPRTTATGKKEQNGDVESSNGALKRRLEQALLLRGSRDFVDADAWQGFVHEVLRKANTTRSSRLAEELAVMRKVRTERLVEFVEVEAVVSSWSTVRVRHCAYSVPSRLIGETVRVHVYDARIEVYASCAASVSSATECTGSTTATSSGRSFASPQRSHATSIEKSYSPRSSFAARTTRSKTLIAAPPATWNTSASFTSRPARWRLTSRPRYPVCSQRSAQYRAMR